ncbi:MAG: hypothetical protein AAGE52_08850 [Myxococcota bacterium]
MSDLVDILEPAKSGRAKCRSTGDKIAKGELRFGEAFVNTFSSSGSISYRWYKLLPAAKKFPARLKKVLETFDGDVPDRAEIDKVIAAGMKKEGEKPTGYPYANRAPTGRASCIVCGEKIPKGSIRIAVEREIDTGSFVRKGPGYMLPSSVKQYCEDEGLDYADFVQQIKDNTVDSVIPDDEIAAAFD